MIIDHNYENTTTLMSKIIKDKIFGTEEDFRNYLENFLFFEFSLEDLNLPEAGFLLEKASNIEKQIGLHNWTTKNFEFDDYKGFSLTYNKDYVGDQEIFNQTLGTKSSTQVYGVEKEKEKINIVKNTYYDTLAFRHTHPVIKKEFNELFNNFNCGISRSRISYFYPHKTKLPDASGIHIDELPFFLLRVNIPLKTNSNHILKINGNDGFGNTLQLEKHLEVGKAYIWNTKIPHQVTIKEETADKEPRIHIVLGITPWLNYHENFDFWTINSNFKIPMKDYVSKKMFIK
jgi:hypothetical protein